MEVVSKSETITRKKQVEDSTSAPTKGKSKKKSEGNQEEKEREGREGPRASQEQLPATTKKMLSKKTV